MIQRSGGAWTPLPTMIWIKLGTGNMDGGWQIDIILFSSPSPFCQEKINFRKYSAWGECVNSLCLGVMMKNLGNCFAWGVLSKNI